MRILITGAFGYVGGRVAVALRRRGAEVVLSGRRVPEDARWAADYETRLFDLAAGDAMGLTRGIDVVVHLASLSPAAANADPAGAFTLSGLATRRLITDSLAEGVTRFLFASTASVYGPAPVGVVTELTRAWPADAYAASHLAGEAFCNEACRKLGKSWAVAMRLANVYGAALTSPERTAPVHNDLCRLAVRSGAITLKSPGEQSRDLVWVEDVAQAIWVLATTPEAALGEPLFNVGGALRVTVAELAAKVAAIASKRLGKTIGVVKPAGEPTPGFDYSIERLARLGYTPTSRLEEETEALLAMLGGDS